jgi:hypothetical protein
MSVDNATATRNVVGNSILDYRLESLDHRVREWARKNAVKIAKRTYGVLFKQIAFGEQLSERYANSLEIFLINKGGLSGSIKVGFNVDYFDEETGTVPLWEFFEYGTRRHFIEPVNKQALRWETGGTTGSQQQTLTQALSSNDNPDKTYAFSKGHFVSGIKPRKVLYKTLQRGTNKFNKELAKGAEKFIKQTATSIGI